MPQGYPVRAGKFGRGAGGKFVRTMTLTERFESYVERGEGCWQWTGPHNEWKSPKSRNKTPYGRFLVGERFVPAHRYAYELWVGPIAAGLTIDHLCHNTLCVNPAHMEPVTPATNLARRLSRGRRHSTSPVCAHGHTKTPESTYTTRRGWFKCKICLTEQARARALLRRAA